MKTVTVQLNNQDYTAKSLMSWRDVEKADSVLNTTLLSIDTEIQNADTPAEQARLTKEIRKQGKTQVKFVESMLEKYYGIKDEDFENLTFVDGLILFAKLYKASTQIPDFLEKPSGQPSS